MKVAPHRFGAVAAWLLTSAALASPIEIPIDTAGSTGFVPMVYGSYTVGAALSSSVESDGYTFSAAAGDKIRIVVSSSTSGLDSLVQLRGPTGTVVGSASCSGHDGFGNPILCATSLNSALATAGTYTVNMSDSGTNNSGAYTLHLDQYPPVGNWLALSFETTVQYAVDHLGDSDYFGFGVNAGSVFRVAVASKSPGLDARVEVWDPTGASPQTTACAGHDGFGNPILCSAVIDINATASGIYKVGVDDSGWNNVGTYQIGLACQFGVCPAVPELPTNVLLGLGLSAIGWRRLCRISRKPGGAWPPSSA